MTSHFRVIENPRLNDYKIDYVKKTITISKKPYFVIIVSVYDELL